MLGQPNEINHVSLGDSLLVRVNLSSIPGVGGSSIWVGKKIQVAGNVGGLALLLLGGSTNINIIGWLLFTNYSSRIILIISEYPSPIYFICTPAPELSTGSWPLFTQTRLTTPSDLLLLPLLHHFLQGCYELLEAAVYFVGPRGMLLAQIVCLLPLVDIPLCVVVGRVVVEPPLADLDILKPDVPGQVIQRVQLCVETGQELFNLLSLVVAGVEGVGFGKARVVAVVRDGARPVPDIVLPVGVHIYLQIIK